MNCRPDKPGSSEFSKAKTQAGLVQRSSTFNYDESQVMSAWESFLTGGTEQEYSNIRPLVQESWKRCQSVGIDAHGVATPLRNDHEYLHKLREDNHDLLTAAAGSLDMLKHMLDHASAMIILTDRDGVILENFGDSRTVEAGRDIHLEVGGNWNENSAGTNGIGTAISTGKPVLIHAAEHYCQDVKAWTCAAAPIFEPFDGSIVGVVDLSGPTEIFQRHNMTVPVIAARQIEQILHQRGTDERIQLMEACFDCVPRINDQDGLVVLDRHGRVIFSKNAPRLALDGAPEHSIKAGDRLYSPAVDMTDADIAALLPEESAPKMIESLSIGGKIRGTVMVFENNRGPASKPIAKKFPAVKHNAVPVPLILGQSAKLLQAVDIVGRAAAGRASVLIEGETGVGKELFGRLFHAHTSKTAAAPFVTVNCGGITKDLFAGELFGHVSGAFTGALREGKKGKFELANGGILVLDEIGEMPLDVQPFLLRALEEKVIYRLGDNKARPVDVHLVALTNRNLLEEVEAGRFRRDLYYRISALKISIPPLRDRGEDAGILLDHFNRSFAEELGAKPLQFSKPAMAALSSYSWPGNVRELRNLVESLHLTSPQNMVDLRELGNSGIDVNRQPARSSDHNAFDDAADTNDLEEMQRRMIKQAIEDNNGNLTLAALQIGIARSTLYRKMAQYNIQRSYD